ncbi:MAG: hypothetical protein Kow0089_02010 [Desulfobulbaceae bacterium]
MMNERQLSLGVRNPWFEKRRDFFVRQMIDEFFSVSLSFQDLYRVYLEWRGARSMACADLLDEDLQQQRNLLWDGLVRLVGEENSRGPLWQLKDLCHRIWPEGGIGDDVGGSLLDWLIGSMFHEIMKCKENIYLLNRYGPAACRMKERSPHNDHFYRNGVSASPAERLDSMIDIQGLMRRAAADAARQMEQTALLIGHASYMVRLMLRELAGNPLVVRLLVEREETVRHLWCEEPEDIFADLYAGDSAEGFCVAGRSYLRGQWFMQALKMFGRALEIDPTCDEALTKMVQLQAVVKENRELLAAGVK